MGTIRFIEGMTCCGKTTLVQGLHEIDLRPILLEHPPRLDFGDDWVGHQRRVFEAYYEAFRRSHGEVFADFSPFACIPFTLACQDAGYITLEDCVEMVNWMVDRLNTLCTEQSCYLYRYLKEDLVEIHRRLSTRGRLGDDQWDPALLACVRSRYDEFFDWGHFLLTDSSGKITRVEDYFDRHLTLTHK